MSSSADKDVVLLHLRLRGLVGFVRDGDYYNVITDHAVSTQLVLKEELAASSSPRLNVSL